MATPSSMVDLSTTAASNSPAGSESPTSGDDFLRAIQAILRTTNAKGADIASATTTDIGAATGEFIDVTGTTTITGLGTIAAGIVRTVRFTGALTLTHNATSLILPGSANITTANGDVAMFRSLGSGNWKCVGYLPQSGYAKAGVLASSGITGAASSGANSDITSLSALSTPLSVAQGGTGAATHTANNVLLGNGTSAFSEVAPGTSGNILTSNGTTWTSAAANSITIGTPAATTSGATVDITGIPSTAKRLTIMLFGVSTNGSSPVVVRLGTSGGIVASGYLTGTIGGNGAGTAVANNTTGFQVEAGSLSAAATVRHGSITFTLYGNDTWIGAGNIGSSNSAQIGMVAGSIALGSPLTQIRITTSNGTDAFDAGAINISYQ